MAKGRFVAYYRVSTARQGRSGLGLDAQRRAVMDYLNGGRWRLVEDFTEVESGKRNDRPELARALTACRVHNAILVIAKLDRLARNVEFIARLMNSGVEFVAVDMPQANRLTVHILAAMAEHEREMISARTKAALAQAKARGVRLGGDRGNLRALGDKGSRASATARSEAARSRAADLSEVIDALRKEGALSLRQLAAGLNARQIAAPRGGEWKATQVRRILAIADHGTNTAAV
jgi:DNA invertase Pin-like site-specific DNA recombinase